MKVRISGVYKGFEVEYEYDVVGDDYNIDILHRDIVLPVTEGLSSLGYSSVQSKKTNSGSNTYDGYVIMDKTKGVVRLYQPSYIQDEAIKSKWFSMLDDIKAVTGYVKLRIFKKEKGKDSYLEKIGVQNESGGWDNIWQPFEPTWDLAPFTHFEFSISKWEDVEKSGILSGLQMLEKEVHIFMDNDEHPYTNRNYTFAPKPQNNHVPSGNTELFQSGERRLGNDDDDISRLKDRISQYVKSKFGSDLSMYNMNQLYNEVMKKLGGNASPQHVNSNSQLIKDTLDAELARLQQR
jgi:hypothetical protein